MLKKHMDKLTWYETGSIIEYSVKPQGVLDVVRLVQGHQDCWPKLTPARVYKKKTLILADWWIGGWSSLILTRTRTLLSELLENGFTIYIWQDSDFILLEDIPQLINVAFFKLINPEHKEVIIRAAIKKYKLPYDSLFVIQHLELQELLDTPAHEHKTIPDNYLIHSKYSLEQIKIIENSVPSFNTVILNSLHNKDVINTLNKLWPTIKQKKYCHSLMLNADSRLHEISSKIYTEENTEIIDLSHLSLDITDFSTHSETLCNKLLAMPSLRSMEISSYPFNAKSNAPNYPDQLECLIAWECIEMAQALITTSHATLKCLRIDLKDNYLNLNPKVTLNSLNHLEIKDSHSEDLLMLIKKSPNLVSLNLSDACLERVLPQSIRLDKLQSITITGFCDGDVLISLLALAVNCKYLDVTSATISNTSLKADFPNISSIFLGNESALVLKSLSCVKNLTVRNNLNRYAFLNDMQLPNLKSLTITHAQITPENLEPFLVAQPGLNSLTFGECEGYKCDASYQALLQHVQNIHLIAPVKSGDPINTITNTPNIRSLNLQRGNRTLSDLENNCLLQSATQLKQLVLKSDDMERWITSIHLPSSIETLHLCCEFISPGPLKKIIRTLPALRHLTFTAPSSICCKTWQLDNELQTLFETIERITWPSSYYQSDEINPTLSSFELSSSNESCDIITDQDNKELNVNRIFYPTILGASIPSPANYRLTTYNTLAFSTKDSVFDYQKIGELDLVETNIEHTETCELLYQHGDYIGRQVVHLNEKWQSIASLSPNETLTHCYLSKLSPTQHAEEEKSSRSVSNDTEILYSRRDNLYYIRSLNGEQTISLTFVLSIKNGPSHPENIHIQQHIKNFRSFTANKLSLPNTHQSKEEILDAILSQKVGACRHRAIAFLILMQRDFAEYPVRIINNDCHSFVEIKQHDFWVRCDLGGYPGKLNITEFAIDIREDTIPSISKQKNHFLSYFQTWLRNHEPHQNNLPLYIQHLLNGKYKKQLIHIHVDKMASLIVAIQHQALRSSHSVFYVHSPDDLVCSAPFIRRNGNQGEICVQKGGGGSLHDFLIHSHDISLNSSLLIINYSNFSSNDIIRFNGLLDEKRHADGTLLSENTVVIGLFDPEKPDAYSGADFYSRFDNIEQYPLIPLPPLVPILQEITSNDHLDNPIIINLCHQANWLTKLMGGWFLHEGKLQFEEGALTAILYEKKGQHISALESGRPIIIQNPPKDSAFELFWQRASLYGAIYYAGMSYSFPSDIKLYSSKGYSWDALLKQFTWFPITQSQCDEIILNPSTLSDFLSQYQFNAQGLFTRQAGWIDKYASLNASPLKILLTRTLSEDEWGIFFDELQKYPTLSVVISTTSNVLLPESFHNPLSLLYYEESEGGPPSDETTIAITSDDPDLTIFQLKQTHPNVMIIDISECQITDLIKRIDGRLENLQFVFSETELALSNALKNAQCVILTGEFSEVLLDNLASFVRARLIQSNVPGKLILVSSGYFEFIPETYRHEPTREELYQGLIDSGFTEDELKHLYRESPLYFQHAPFISLITRLQFKRKHPDQSSQQLWNGLHELPFTHQSKPFDIKTSNTDACTFLQNRVMAVTQMLEDNPYIFLTGLTGVGKSRFVEHELKKRTLFHGEHSITTWAQAQPDCNPTLFIDEANLSSKKWSEFEGLFQDPPGLLCNGVYYQLTKQHKVIFAGNPLNYGDERTLLPLFLRHGNTHVFEPLPSSVIYETILKPILDQMLSPNEVSLIANKLLEIYQFLINASCQDVLISPRQIQMMALATIAHKHQGSTLKIDEIAQLRARDIASTFLPRQHLERFNQSFPEPKSVRYLYSDPSSCSGDKLLCLLKNSVFHFKPIAPPSVTPHPRNMDGFLTTPSRKKTIWQLTNFLTVRDFQRHTNSNAVFLRFGGLHRFVIEGEPGIGKSEMVLQLLLKSGFREAHVTDKTVHSGKNLFYRISASMQPTLQLAILMQAFDLGAVVIIDEINSMSTFEKLLNSLLDGKHPEENNRPPHTPGFRIIGTQNPPSMAGRRWASHALENRTQTIQLPPYPIEEMHAILENMGLSSNSTRTELINAYQIAIHEANIKHLSPAPGFRDLIRIAKHIIAKSNIENELKENVSELRPPGRTHT